MIIFVAVIVYYSILRLFLSDYFKSRIMAKAITNENYSDIMAGGKPVVIDFWATWCGPCRALAPTVDEVAAEYEGKVEVVKCNVDDCGDIAAEFRVRNIPTLVYIKDGVLADRTVGRVPKDLIVEKIEALLR